MMRGAGAQALALLAFCALGTVGCSGCEETGVGDPAAGTPPPPIESPSAHGSGRVLRSIIDELPRCDIDHRGLSIDAGTAAFSDRLDWAVTQPEWLKDTEHDGATWAELYTKTLSWKISLPEATPIFLQGRVRGRAARAAVLSIDGYTVGSWLLKKDEVRVATTKTTDFPADAGEHTITMRFLKTRRSDDEPYGEIDWIRVGTPDELDVTYGAPTLRDIVLPKSALDGVPHRSIGLRAPGAVRCGLRIPKRARLRTSIGLQGSGDANVQVRVLIDGKEPVVVANALLEGGESARWKELDIDLDPFAGTLAQVELRAASGTPTGLVLFGDPEVVLATAPPEPAPPAQLVFVVVLSGLERGDLPGFMSQDPPANYLPTLRRLAESGTVYVAQRAPAVTAGAAVASLLTGQLPGQHGLSDRGARLPKTTSHVGKIAHEAGVHAAMFTDVPSTFGSFGFDVGWERFESVAPSNGDPSKSPLELAQSYVRETLTVAPESKVFVVAHVRGGHPPWPATKEEVGELPPENYAGDLGPRTAGQLLGKLRQRRNPRLSASDRERARALQTLSLTRQDRSLANLVSALEEDDVLDRTMLIVVGDVSSGLDSLFDPDPELDEERLGVPLIVRFPGGLYGGREVTAPTTHEDLFRTAVNALGLQAPKRGAGRGRDLAMAASDRGPDDVGPQIATRGDEYAVRWGSLVLRGVSDKSPRLCDVIVDPTCAVDRRPLYPVAAATMFRSFVEEYRSTLRPAEEREPATIDDTTQAALRVYGEDKEE